MEERCWWSWWLNLWRALVKKEWRGKGWSYFFAAVCLFCWYACLHLLSISFTEYIFFTFSGWRHVTKIKCGEGKMRGKARPTEHTQRLKAAHGPDTSNYRKYVQVFNYIFIKKSQKQREDGYIVCCTHREKCIHCNFLFCLFFFTARNGHIFSYIIILPFLFFWGLSPFSYHQRTHLVILFKC